MTPNSINQQLFIAHQALIAINSRIKSTKFLDPISTLETIENIEKIINNALDDLESLANQADIFETHNTADAMPIGV